MRISLRYGAIALALLGSAGLAAAADDAASGKINSGTVMQAPSSEAPKDSGAAGPRDAETQPAGSPAGATTGLAPSGPIGATPQTMPSTLSAENEKLDKLPIMAQPLHLSDDDKRMVFDSVASNSEVETRSIDTEPANTLPADVKLFDLPEKVSEQMPALKGYKYVKLTDKIVIVSAPNRIVVGEITR